MSITFTSFGPGGARVLGAALFLAWAFAAPAMAQKGKPAPAPNAIGTVTFADGMSDEIVSDGGAYEGATIYSGGTLYLDISTLANRRLSITLRDKVNSLGSFDTVLPDTYLSNGVFRIDNINAIPGSNGWGRSTGRVSFGSAIPNHVLGFRYATSNGVPVYGTNVCVKRVANVQPATWLVASSEQCSTTDGAKAGLFEEGLSGKGYRAEAIYPVKFMATVTCTSGSTCPL